MNLTHLGIHNSLNKNSGDTLLFKTVRDIFEYKNNYINWDLQQIWDLFDIDKAKQLNKTSDGIVVGGGGLFLGDQKGASVENSGWQWNSTLEALDEIKIPIIVYAIGYNRFRNQEDFSDIFSQHLNKLVEKSSFFSLRNNGSIRAIKKYIKEENHKKLILQFCPTMCLWQLNQVKTEFLKSNKINNSFNKRLALNMAFDRANLRFNSNKVEILKSVAKAIKYAEESKWKICLVLHKEQDFEISKYLDELFIEYKLFNLTNSLSEEIIAFYEKVDYVIGMRGHSQMIPFGLRKPIMSLISHDKMAFLLEDINRPEWGIEVQHDFLTDSIIEQLKICQFNYKERLNDIFLIQEKVWKESINNLSSINSILKNKN